MSRQKFFLFITPIAGETLILFNNLSTKTIVLAKEKTIMKHRMVKTIEPVNEKGGVLNPALQ